MTLDIFFLVRDCFNAGDGFAVADIYIYIYIYIYIEREREREREREILNKWKLMPYFHNWLY